MDGLTVEQGDGFDVRVLQDGACVAVFPIEAYTDGALVPCSWDMADSMQTQAACGLPFP